MQSVGTLAGGVAHEFNNLLAGINGYASLGLREAGRWRRRVREFLQNVVDLSERAADADAAAAGLRPQAGPEPAADLDPRPGPRHGRAGVAHAAPGGRRGDRAGLRPTAAAGGGGRRQPAAAGAGQPGPQRPRRRGRARRRDGRRTGDAPGRDRRKSSSACGRRRRRRPRRLPAERAAGRLRAAAGGGPRRRHVAGSAEPGARPVLHDQGGRPGHGPGPADGVRHRPGPPGLPDHRQRARRRGRASASTCRAWSSGRRPDGVAARRSRDPEVVQPESSPGRSILVIDDEEAVLDVVRRFLQIAGHRWPSPPAARRRWSC